MRRQTGCACVAGVATAWIVLAGSAAAATLPVIPGAVGYGIATPAGRGGAVLRVATLDPGGPGSLAAALATKGPRTLVFEVGGAIDLQGQTLVVDEPFVTVAGQTAPSPGITLVNGSVQIRTHDVLLQHLRFRPGDGNKPKRSGWSPDGLTTCNLPGTPGPHHVVIDHCSYAWAVDENLSASGQRHEGRAGTSHDMTFANCIVAECLNDSTHEKGPHSKGTLIHDHARDIAIIGNLYACNVERNPVLKPDAGVVVVNNLIYNPARQAVHSYWTPKEYVDHPDTLHPCTLVAVGNVLWYGPDTPDGLRIIHIAGGKGEVFARDNLALDRAGRSVEGLSGNPRLLDERPFWPTGLEPLPTARVAEAVLARAGAWPAVRDAVDRRIVEGVRNRTGRIIDSPRDVGGPPTTAPTRHTLALPADLAGDADRDGYTNLEEWLHAQAAAVEGAR